jgi:hypothetical protein
MNNEPVAWMLTDRVVSSVPIEGAIPLYLHPAKTLTDDEILEIAQPMFEAPRYPSTALDFARAILRKAQEK